MSTFIVPPLDEDPWPSLGADVAAHMEESLAFGPGDLHGQPFKVDDEFRAVLERAYQVYPKGHPKAGRRRFDIVVLDLAKGMAKTERLAAIAAMEIDPDAPVRCDGWRRQGRAWVPVGRPVTDPVVWLFAFSKEQAEDTAWDAMREMINEGPGADRYDVWEAEIVRRHGRGMAKPLAAAPDSRDGGRTTFQGKEESHRWTLPRQKEADKTTRGNLSKRPAAQPWEMHASTMYAPGEGSVLEELHDAAKALHGEPARRSRLFFFYRYADTRIRIRREDGSWDHRALREAILDARGPVCGAWSDIDSIKNLQFTGPGADAEYAERVWLNRSVKRRVIAFDVERWKSLAKSKLQAPTGTAITVGFDGSKSDDWTAAVATELTTGFQWPVGTWKPEPDTGLVDVAAVDAEIDATFAAYNVVRMYVDPPYWKEELAAWQGRYGDKVVIKWETWRNRPMGFACRSFETAIRTGSISHSGDDDLTAAIGHCHRKPVSERDDQGQQLWTVMKERQGSPLKIDPGMAAILSWEARNDAIASGAAVEPQRSRYEDPSARLEFI